MELSLRWCGVPVIRFFLVSVDSFRSPLVGERYSKRSTYSIERILAQDLYVRGRRRGTKSGYQGYYESMCMIHRKRFSRTIASLSRLHDELSGDFAAAVRNGVADVDKWRK